MREGEIEGEEALEEASEGEEEGEETEELRGDAIRIGGVGVKPIPLHNIILNSFD